MVNKELTKEELLKIEQNIGKILRIGVFVSTTVIIIGILMFLLSGHSGYAEGVWPDKFNEILSGLVEFKALAYDWIIPLNFDSCFASSCFNCGFCKRR